MKAVLKNTKTLQKCKVKPEINFVLSALSDFNSKRIYYMFAKENLLNNSSKEVLQQEISTNKIVLEETNKKVKEKVSKRGRFLSTFFFLFSILMLGGVLIYQINAINKNGFEDLVKVGVNLNFIWIAFGIFVVIMCLEAIRTHVLILKATKVSKPFVSYKSAAICRCYDCLTPFSSGGQTFQAFYLNNRGLKGGISVSVPMAKYMFHQVAFVIISICVLIFGMSYVQNDSNLVIVLGSVGLILSCLVLFGMIFISVSKKLAPRIIMWGLKVGGKLKLVKNPRKTFIITMRQVLEYQKSVKYFAKTWWVCLTSILTSVLIVILNALIPFVIYCAFNTPTFSVAVQILVNFVICELAVRYVPIPGGSGVAEISFTALFASLFAEGALFWSLLIWRFFSYYIYLIQGLVVIIYDFVYGNRKNKRKLLGKQKLGLKIK